MKAPTAAHVAQHANRFKAWLLAHGAEVLEPTNEYELVRFRTGKGTSVIYRKKEINSYVTFIGDGETAWREFQTPGSNWRAIPATKRRSGRSRVDCIALRKRDGHKCFFCCRYVPEEDETVEHLVALAHGGPQHMSNKFLSHAVCNRRAGHLSALEKIKIHDLALIKEFSGSNYERAQSVSPVGDEHHQPSNSDSDEANQEVGQSVPAT